MGIQEAVDGHGGLPRFPEDMSGWARPGGQGSRGQERALLWMYLLGMDTTALYLRERALCIRRAVARRSAQTNRSWRGELWASRERRSSRMIRRLNPAQNSWGGTDSNALCGTTVVTSTTVLRRVAKNRLTLPTVPSPCLEMRYALSASVRAWPAWLRGVREAWKRRCNVTHHALPTYEVYAPPPPCVSALPLCLGGAGVRLVGRCSMARRPIRRRPAVSPAWPPKHQLLNRISYLALA